MSKYIIDIDALKDCLDLLPRSFSDADCVELRDVFRMINKFPKDEFDEEYYIENEVNEDILSGKGLKPLEKDSLMSSGIRECP